MSVSLHLSVVFRGYDPRHADAIKREIRTVVEREQLQGDLPPLAEAEDGRGRYLFSRTDRDHPVIISGAYRWVPAVLLALQEAVARANGGPCEVAFDCEDADDQADDDGDDGEDEDQG